MKKQDRKSMIQPIPKNVDQVLEEISRGVEPQTRNARDHLIGLFEDCPPLLVATLTKIVYQLTDVAKRYPSK